MANVAIVYFSGYGHTKKLAEAVEAGAKGVSGTTVSTVQLAADGTVAADTWDKLAAADAVIFGSPTYMGGPAWQFKKFADESSKPWYVQAWKDKFAGGFTNSASTNGDKHGTINYFQTLAMQHSMLWVSTGLMPSNKKENGPGDVNWTGGQSGLLAISPSDASAEEAPRAGDLEGAKQFGARIATLAAKRK